ncbi:hypothetical protein BG000_002986 [Podila horticola]|nr:hypothetical protein BG000_002986 [Podila horticola]
MAPGKKRIKDIGGDLFWKGTILRLYEERFHYLTNPVQPEASLTGTGSSPGPSSTVSAPPGAAPSPALSSIVSVTKADEDPDEVSGGGAETFEESLGQGAGDKDDGKDATNVLTFTISDSSVQPWPMEYQDTIDDLATEMQDRLTTVMTHLTFLAQKALMMEDEEVSENDDDMDIKPQVSGDVDPLPISTWK